jgi:hypothetical protein
LTPSGAIADAATFIIIAMTMAAGAVVTGTASLAPPARSAVDRSSDPAQARIIGKPVRRPVLLGTRTFAGRT